MILQVQEIRVRKEESVHSPWYKQLYLPVCECLTGQLEFRFNQASLLIAKAVDAVFVCDKNGIQPLVHQYADTLNINPQPLAAEMELFSSTDKKLQWRLFRKNWEMMPIPNTTEWFN